MQLLSASLEIAVGPQPARTEVSGAGQGAMHDRSDDATPRTSKARGVCFSRPARRAGILGRDAR
ncbi:hypothetical protein [Pseudoxanthomonas sp. 10H]|uniref:hypothetical protein n=1 Tax=Pseudoxanthomonas sp. 10H TaxID=3242729 RepID=UPI0035565903